jgi:hypothetical protein
MDGIAYVWMSKLTIFVKEGTSSLPSPAFKIYRIETATYDWPEQLAAATPRGPPTVNSLRDKQSSVSSHDKNIAFSYFLGKIYTMLNIRLSL